MEFSPHAWQFMTANACVMHTCRRRPWPSNAELHRQGWLCQLVTRQFAAQTLQAPHSLLLYSKHLCAPCPYTHPTQHINVISTRTCCRIITASSCLTIALSLHRQVALEELQRRVLPSVEALKALYTTRHHHTVPVLQVLAANQQCSQLRQGPSLFDAVWHTPAHLPAPMPTLTSHHACCHLILSMHAPPGGAG